jgi:cation-transporting ATPase E
VRFAVPAGIIAGTAALSVYFVARSVEGTTLTESRTAATVTLLGVGLGLLVRLTSTLPAWRWALVAAMAVATALALVVPPIATFFDLAYPPAAVWWTMAGVLLVALVAVRFVPTAGDDDPADQEVGGAVGGAADEAVGNAAPRKG